jgi:glucosamine-6-phosphate deaminase
MTIEVYITRDFEQMSDVAASLAVARIREIQEKKEAVLGLATGTTPTGLYRRLAAAANEGRFDSARIRSFNLDEYIGLPGDDPQQRVLHPESYAYFMIQELFGPLKRKFSATLLPSGALVDQKILVRELAKNTNDWRLVGTDAGKSIVIKKSASSAYLAWIKREILDGYARKIRQAGGIDLQIVGVGGRGHVAFHEAGIPFDRSPVLLVKLDGDTIANAVRDGHFASEEESPHYALSMGARLVYQAGMVLLLANGERKTLPVTRSLLGQVTPEVPISYGQKYAKQGGRLVYVLDAIAGGELLRHRDKLAPQGISLRDLTSSL